MLQKAETDTPELLNIFSKLLNSNVVTIERITGGHNSKIYKIECEKSKRYVGKLYYRSNLDKRDRRGVEFKSLQFLWDNGIRCIPQPIATDREHNCSIYQYIEGEKLFSSEISITEIDYAVEFLIKLDQLKNTTSSNNSNASEACFSLQEIIDNIYLRLNRLLELKNDDTQYQVLQNFLNNDFISAFNTIQYWAKSRYREVGIHYGSKLPLQERTLSPSDFGFHNALKCPDGEIIFLDFEYFGWDDPAKMISDFLLHPAMELDFNLKKRFVDKILLELDVPDYFLTRLKAVYPLFGFKWCMILLNEFLKDDINRRNFSSTKSEDASLIRLKQLSKAKNLLERINLEYEGNKYFR